MKLGKVLSFIFFSACLSFYHFSSAQTNISGVVNSYYNVVEIIPAKACVRVGNPAGLNQNDRAMVIQMKGATINTSSSSSFGDTVSLNNAGNYELGTICYIRGDSVFFVYMLLNQYTASGKVQLVKVPEYYSANVIDTLKAAPWNNTTGTGGVLAIFVDEDLSLNAPISADSSGFRGGGYRLSNGTCNNSPGANAYDYNANSTSPQNGAFKGEGVGDVVTAQTGGRGAPANGGGGGNNHNNGGAGGANLNTGGDGGGNSSSTGCTLPFVGKAGKALSSYGGKKVFLGGGGGAGHVNNGFVTSNGGGHGGGLVFIRANDLIGNNYKISANGQVGGPAASDGASGGGAGGTIIMAVNNYTGSTTIAANGGQGGTEDDGLNLNKCYGSGGGGSGGVVYFSGTTPAIPVTVNGGNAGPEVNHDASCNAAVSSLAGSSGQIIPNYTYSISLVLTNNYCTILLPSELAWFTAQYINEQITLNWKVTQPESFEQFIIERSGDANDWIVIGYITANDGLFVYRYEDLSSNTGNNYYRIKLIKKNNAFVYSSIRKIFIAGKNESFEIYPNPATKKIFISGSNTSSRLLLFDATGKLLWKKNIISSQGIAEADLPSLSPGIYIIQIGHTARRLIIR
jgi:Secretion system C-terminal sorting domain